MEDFSYEDDLHLYRNAAGVVRPSVTETLKLAGVISYRGINPDVLEHARVRGTNVHRWTAEYDLSNGADDDPTKVTGEEYDYCCGWLKFLADTEPEILEVEKPMLGTILGCEVGGTPDRLLKIGGRIYITDLKTAATLHPAWKLQTADYEMLRTGKDYLGSYGRMTVRLLKNRTYRLDHFNDTTDGIAAIAALQLVTWCQNNNLMQGRAS